MKHLIKRTSSEAICFVSNYLLILALLHVSVAEPLPLKALVLPTFTQRKKE